MKRNESYTEVEATILASGGKVLVGTVPQGNKLNDDKAPYTGVHANGRPIILNKYKINDIGKSPDRNEADIRGRRIEKSPPIK